MTKYVVATVDEIPPGERKIVEIEGRSIGIFNVSGEFFAIRNRCPHQGAPLCEGRVSGFVVSQEPGNYIWTRKGEIIRCPWHAWEFDIKTGQSWYDPSKIRVRSYDTKIESGCTLSAGSDKQSEAETEKGPYVVESYPVSIEKEYVTITI